MGAVAFGGSWDLSGAKEMGKEWGDKGSKEATPFFHDQEAVCLSPSPVVGVLTPPKEPQSGDRESWVPVLTLPFLAR